ncbi:hypothetical protein ONE63_003280 [Megalurothrips usitatus]|uniref:Single domain-containing protein n=1 Tax=Megalurothrips usitatus TaxID=439358 RepID=A0AAV7XB13_9NEOP|nr:hypothetical protein ONE63_003280 [Megalurothrips usitatus]
MAVGEVFNTGPEPCSTYTCHEPNSVYALTCAFWTAGEGCEIVAGNQSSVYPGCCPTESCSDNLINVDEKEKYSL